MQKSYVSYLRVSTRMQGRDGLGIEAQRNQVQGYVRDTGVILTEYVEVESGANDERQQLTLALAEAKRTGATLIIAKLDRLSRNVGFIFALRDSGVNFVCCDIPDANTLTIGLFAVMAQHEREIISKRVRDALAAKKAQGFKLGGPMALTPEAIAKSVAVRQQKALENPQNRQATRLAQVLRQDHTLRQIADELNRSGYVTRNNKQFTAAGVQRLLERAERS